MDPLATSDKDNDDESEEESNREPNDTDWTGEDAKLDAELARSEEIIVVSIL